MAKYAFSCDGTNQYFCLAGSRCCKFFCADPSARFLSQTDSPHNHHSFVSTIAGSNIIAIVAQGTNEVQILDRFTSSIFPQVRITDATITGLRLRPDVLVLVCDSKVLVYNLASNQQIATMNTAPNQSGAVAVECSYSSLVIAVPSVEIGYIEIYDCLDPGAPMRSIAAFDKPIRILEFSRNRALIAVATDLSQEIVIFSTVTGQKLRTLMLRRKERVVRLLFDEFAMHLVAQFENKGISLWQLPILDETVPVKAMPVAKPDTSYSLSRPFWVFFGAKLFALNVVTEDLILIRLKFDSSAKAFKEVGKEDLKDLAVEFKRV
jgi:hypothetical protein